MSTNITTLAQVQGLISAAAMNGSLVDWDDYRTRIAGMDRASLIGLVSDIASLAAVLDRATTGPVDDDDDLALYLSSLNGRFASVTDDVRRIIMNA